jgi:hypothetical protein
VQTVFGSFDTEIKRSGGVMVSFCTSLLQAETAQSLPSEEHAGSPAPQIFVGKGESARWWSLGVSGMDDLW